MSNILETIRRLPGFVTLGEFTKESRGIPCEAIYKYYNQYGHITDRCKNLRILVDGIVRKGKLREFVKE